jgi:hypothetical protein
MAFPFLADENFDDGTLGNFDSETDASAILDFPHYAELARGGRAPWQGAHAMRARLNGTAVGFVTETGTFDTAGASTIHIWGTVLIGEDVSIATDGVIVLAALQSAGPVNEACLVLSNTAALGYHLAFGETAATRTFPIVRSNKRWYEFEMSALIDNAGSNDGTLTGYIDGAPVGAVITALDQGAITQFSLGAVSGTSAGDRGTILFGGVMADDARIYPRRQMRFATTKWVTRTDTTTFVGPCEIDSASITATGTDGVLNIYDTDIYEATGVGFARMPPIYTRNVTANDQSPGMNTPIVLNKGCHVQLTGTAPQAWISLKDSCPNGVPMSDENYIEAGRARRGRI